MAQQLQRARGFFSSSTIYIPVCVNSSVCKDVGKNKLLDFFYYFFSVYFAVIFPLHIIQLLAPEHAFTLHHLFLNLMKWSKASFLQNAVLK